MREEILKKFEKEDFAKKIMQMKTKEEVKKALSDEGVTATDEEINELGGLIKEILNKLETLPENELEAVAGGVKGAGTKGGFWSGLGSGLIKLAPTFAGVASDYLWTQSDVAKANATTAQAQSEAAIAAAKAKMVGEIALPVLVVAAASGLYYFRKDIKNFWYSKS